MLESFFKKIKTLCKGCINDEDLCIFIVAALAGFLLCFFLKNNEPFQNFADLNEAYNIEPSQPSMGSGESGSGSTLGLQPKKRETDSVPPPSLKTDYEKAKSANQFPSQNIQNKQGITQMNNAQFTAFQGWDQYGYAPVDIVLNVPKPLNNMGKGPLGPDRPLETNIVSSQPSVPGKSDEVQNELKIVLIYAEWCGHSKRMLPDYQKIEAEFNNKTINNTLVLIEKYTDKEKDKVEEYGVKGFPTLFSHKNGERSPLNERTYEGLKNHIMNNV